MSMKKMAVLLAATMILTSCSGADRKITEESSENIYEVTTEETVLESTMEAETETTFETAFETEKETAKETEKETEKETKETKKPAKHDKNEDKNKETTEAEKQSTAAMESSTTAPALAEPVPTETVQALPGQMGAVDKSHMLDGIDYDSILPLPSGVTIAGATPAQVYQYGGIWQKNPDKKVIYLTFSLAYETGFTQSIMDTLARKNVNAAFFLVAREYVKPQNYPIMKMMVERGHLVGSHGYNHDYTYNLSDVDLINDIVTSTGMISAALGGYPVRFYKAPNGYTTVRAAYICNKLGLTITSNTFQYNDFGYGQFRSREDTLNNLIAGIAPGAVYYLHATKCNAEYLGEFIDYAKGLGYQFLRLDQNSAADSLVVAPTTVAEETETETETEATTTLESTTEETTTEETTTEETTTEETTTEETTEEITTEAETEVSTENETAESETEDLSEQDTLISDEE